MFSFNSIQRRVYSGKQLLVNEFIHGKKLHVFIKDILEKIKIKTTDLNAVAVSKGPGSYTGLRICGCC